MKTIFEPGWISRELFNSYDDYTHISNNVCTTHLLPRHRLFTSICQPHETSSSTTYAILKILKNKAYKIGIQIECFTGTHGSRNKTLAEEDVLQKPLKAVSKTNCSEIRVCSLKDIHSRYSSNCYDGSEQI